MINLPFIFGNKIIWALYDVTKMSKSEMPYWGYDNDPNTVPKVNKEASDWASLTQFVLFYIYTGALAFAIWGFSWTAWVNIGCIAFLHWCGVEDLFYFILSNWIKLPKEYLDTHPQKFGIPDTLYWLSEKRYGIPSIIGFVCDEDVPRENFVVLTILAMSIVIMLWIINPF